MGERERDEKVRDNLVWNAANCDRERNFATVIMKGKTKGWLLTKHSAVKISDL